MLALTAVTQSYLKGYINQDKVALRSNPDPHSQSTMSLPIGLEMEVHGEAQYRDPVSGRTQDWVEVKISAKELQKLKDSPLELPALQGWIPWDSLAEYRPDIRAWCEAHAPKGPVPALYLRLLKNNWITVEPTLGEDAVTNMYFSMGMLSIPVLDSIFTGRILSIRASGPATLEVTFYQTYSWEETGSLLLLRSKGDFLPFGKSAPETMSIRILPGWDSLQFTLHNHPQPHTAYSDVAYWAEVIAARCKVIEYDGLKKMKPSPFFQLQQGNITSFTPLFGNSVWGARQQPRHRLALIHQFVKASTSIYMYAFASEQAFRLMQADAVEDWQVLQAAHH